MNTAAIARHLSISEDLITRCEEWVRVLFVVVKGLGARFVSKKVMAKTYTQKTLSEAVVNRLTNKYGFGTLRPWTKKAGEIRVYLGKKNGYVLIRESVDLDHVKGYKREVESELKDLLPAKCSASASEVSDEPVTEEGLAARHGWAEVVDAQQDVARDDWDI